MSRLNAKGVDALVVWDSCFGGGMREIAPGAAAIRVRRLREAPHAEIRRTFNGIPMIAAEARANVKAIQHVTFLAGADAYSSVPELTGMDFSNPGRVHGALSYYMNRDLRGDIAQGAIIRLTLFNNLRQSVRQASRDQTMDLAPRSEIPAISS